MSSFYPLPPEIEAKVVLLKQHQETIEQLSRECQRLEEEIQVHRLLFAPVKRLPQEILIMIFKYYLGGNARLIRHLLLVSTQWYIIIVNCPTFWTDIDIVLNTHDKEANLVAESVAPWIKACLERSTSLPLNIHINLEDLATAYQYLSAHNVDLPAGLSRSIYMDGLRSHYNTMEVDENWMDYDMHPRHALPVLALLTGENKEIMKRWESLTLRLPKDADDEFMNLLWVIFNGPTPHLTHLSILSADNADERRRTTSPPVFPDLSSLKSLVLDRKEFLNYLNFPFTQIQSLDFCHQGPMYLPEFQLFQSLRNLTLRDGYLVDAHGFSTIKIRLPLLENIAFHGCFGHLKGIQLDFPALRSLSIYHDAVYDDVSLPLVSPEIVKWILVDRTYWDGLRTRSRYEHVRQRALEAILHQYSTMETLVISESWEDCFMCIIGELEKTNSVPASLSLVRVVSDRDDEKELRTWKSGGGAS